MSSHLFRHSLTQMQNRVSERLKNADWTRRLNHVVDSLTDQKLLRSQVAIDPITTTSVVECHRDGARNLKLFASNDYLGLADHPELRHSCKQAIGRYGMGVRSSALICGYSPIHQKLEQQLALHTKQEACLLFPTGFAANLAVVSVLGGGQDVAVFSDALNHASIIDGCRLSKASGAHVIVYKHNNMRHLESLLLNCKKRFKVVVSESLFSMDGDFACLKTLVVLREKYGFLLVIDEAHAMLVAGDSGGGVSELQNVQSEVDVVVGTLSKAFASMGGFVCTSEQLRSVLLTKGRSQVFSTALPIPNVAAALAALRISQRETWRRKHLHQLIQYFASELNVSNDSWIIPVIVGSATDALELSDRLKRRGLLVPAIRPPTVPPGTCRLRVSLSSNHSFEDLKCLITEIKYTSNLQKVATEKYKFIRHKSAQTNRLT